MSNLVIGARQTALAMAELQEFHAACVPDSNFVVRFSPTRDALNKALLAGNIDAFVASARDVEKPVESVVTMAISASPDTSNALVVNNGRNLLTLPGDAKVGIPTERILAAVRQVMPTLNLILMKGNVNDRLIRVLSPNVAYDDKLDAAVIATIALKRLGLAYLIKEILAEEVAPSHPDQGKLVIQGLNHDTVTAEKIAALLRDSPNWSILP